MFGKKGGMIVKKCSKKIFTMFLSVVIAATTIIPMHGIAAENNALSIGQSSPLENESQNNPAPTDPVSPAESEKENNVSPEENAQPPVENPPIQDEIISEEDTTTDDKELPGESTPSEDLPMPDANPSIEENTPVEETGTTGNSLETEENMPVEETGTTGDSLETEENVPNKEAETTEDSLETEEAEKEPAQQLLDAENTIMPAADNFDITKPVIESFVFAENGQTLTANDTLHFTVSAYDADSGIQKITIQIGTNDPGGSGDNLVCTKDENGNFYSGTIPCRILAGKNFHISSIRATDQVGNYSEWPVKDNNSEPLYRFTLEGDFNAHATISDIKMQINDADGNGKLGANDTVTYTANISCTGGTIQRANMHISNDNGKFGYNITADYDADTQKATATFTITEKTYPGTWSPAFLDVYTEAGQKISFYLEHFPAGLQFIVEQEDFDTDKPVIESIIIDKNGQFVSAGDVVTIKVKASDAHLPNSIMASFSPAISGLASSTRTIFLTLNQDTGEYTGTIPITADTYPCEWVLSQLNIRDANENTTQLRDFQEDLPTTYPWYYKVKAGNTYVEDVKDVTFSFYGLSKNENGIFSETYLSSETIKNVGRRASLKELGVALPQAGPAEGVAVIGWKYNGSFIDENTPFLFINPLSGSPSYDFHAYYDKGLANIKLIYLTQDGQLSQTYIAKFVDKNATYKDVLDMLELPSDAETSHFTGFELQPYNGVSEDTKIGDNAYIFAQTYYNSYQIGYTATYGDEKGNVITASSIKDYPAGTKIKDILSDLGNPPNLGTEFEKWIFLGKTFQEDDEISMSNLHLIKDFHAAAVYKGKTTVNATYIYKNEDGTTAHDSKIILVDGENPSEASIKENAGKIANGLKHPDGLKLSNWTCIFDEDYPRYKKITFTAQYSNSEDNSGSVNQPGDTDRPDDLETTGNENGSTESANQDASGNGSSEGQATPASTGGIKIPEKKIAEITAEIASASAGAAITIDMKNATVIPKQILESIQGKSMDIILQMNGYRWVINGMDVAASNLKDIDLEVKLDVNAIPDSLVQSIAGDQPAKQLSLTHNGDFGFRAKLVLDLGGEHRGETANLYYYDSSRKLVFIDAGKIDKDGMASLTFSHASDYVVIIDSKTVAKSTELVNDGSNRKSPKTGE